MTAWRERLEKAVTPLASGVRGLQITGYRPDEGEPYRPSRTAAVLVPFLDLPVPELVLTRRADHLPQHAGQVSFPGGAADETDDSAVQTALREAQEEIGLPPGVAEPIGFLDRMDTVSDYRVLPVVAFVRPPVEWRPDSREVAEVFTVPVPIVLNSENYTARSVERAGRNYTLYSMNWKGHTIWGATAGMLMNLIFRLSASHD
jgi:8-oxo-dGTP pyrophosphatase MutT (NUDIX family)